MDLLEDIKRELRSGDGRASDESARTDDTGGAGPAERAAGSTAGPNSATGDDADANGEAGDPAASRERDHLCSFCETEFDASRTVCPECGAEIVLRGAR